MSVTVSFFAHGDPVSKGSMKAFIPKGWNRSVLTSASGPKLKSWAHNVATAAQIAHSEVMGQWDRSAPMLCDLAFYLTRPKSAKKRACPHVKPDVDKLARAVLDALTGILWHDDGQVCTLHARKAYSDDSGERPVGCFVSVETLKETP